MRKRNKSKYDSMFLGALCGFVLPAISMIVFFYYHIERFKTLDLFLNYLINYSVLTNMIALCAVPNLIAFYFFLRKHLYTSAKGVIFATFVLAFVVVIMKFG